MYLLIGKKCTVLHPRGQIIKLLRLIWNIKSALDGIERLMERELSHPTPPLIDDQNNLKNEGVLGCDTPIYCRGSPLKTIQLSSIFKDSKTFVDRPTKRPQEEVLIAFSKLPKNASASVLENFVDTYFSEEGHDLIAAPILQFNPLSLDNEITVPVLKKFSGIVHGYWQNLTRKTDLSNLCEGCSTSLIPLNYSFIVPGGRFREMYYWDSYFVVEGLLVSGLHEMARNTIENLSEMVNRFGFVPNGNRAYYLNRSMPPLLTQIVKIYYEATKDLKFLNQLLPVLRREYEYWRKNSSVRVPVKKLEKNCVTVNFYTLNRYNVQNSSPRPESYQEDYYTVEKATWLNETEKATLYGNIASATESGWDFSSRWIHAQAFHDHCTLIKTNQFDENQNNIGLLRHLNTRSIIPVDLNSILYMNEVSLAQFHEEVGLLKLAKSFRTMATRRHEAIIAVHWDSKNLRFWDFNLTSGHHTAVESLAGFFPFWARVFPEEILQNRTAAEKSFSWIQYLLDRYPGSLPATEIPTGLQWDFPNAWPPLQYAVIKGLINVDEIYSLNRPNNFQNSASSEANKSHLNKQINDSENIFTQITQSVAQRFVSSVFCAWVFTGGQFSDIIGPNNETIMDSGHIFEKYNSTNVTTPGGGGEYVVQTGFGWTNGVFLWMISKFGKGLVQPECIRDPL
ncbi:hypothetical protein G9A89_019184 [Geosiphon pyriformis]|nr:hypothetical protein G9A89_019184 [Geosiphon pyriformis]